MIDALIKVRRVGRTLDQIAINRFGLCVMRVCKWVQNDRSRVFDLCEACNIRIAYFQAVKPNENGHVERFSRSFRESVLRGRRELIFRRTEK